MKLIKILNNPINQTEKRFIFQNSLHLYVKTVGGKNLMADVERHKKRERWKRNSYLNSISSAYTF